MAAALRTCPRVNPGAVSRLVSGYAALRRLELRLLALRSLTALSAATETCALPSFPYIYWLLLLSENWVHLSVSVKKTTPSWQR